MAGKLAGTDEVSILVPPRFPMAQLYLVSTNRILLSISAGKKEQWQ